MTDRTRIAHVTTAHPVQDNRIFQKECRALAAAGFDVHLVAVAPQDQEIAGVSIKALPLRRRRLARMVLGPVDAWTALRRVRPELIHVHDPELIPLAVLWRLVRRRPAIFDAHEDLPKQVMGKAYLPPALRRTLAAAAVLLEGVAERCLDAVVAATPSISTKFRRRPAVLVQNFPWLAAFPKPSDLTDTERDVVYIGAINDGRGLSTMLELATHLPARSTLTLAGPVSDVDGLALAEQDPTRCRYLGVVDVQQIPDLLSTARLGLALLRPLPNYVDSQATKIYEYMAAGRPFLASDFASWMAQLGPYDCGLFVDPADPEAIRSAVRYILTDTEAARLMGRRGRRAFEQHFVFDREAPRLVELTRRLSDAAR